MSRILLLGGVVVLALVASAGWGWRIAAKRRALPCPPWLILLLENPYTEALAGAKTLLDRAAVEEGMRVLDIGSGPGRLTLPAAERVGPSGSVLALDIQPEMVRRLQERLAAGGIDSVEVVLGGVGDGKIEGNGFDRAFLVTVLGEIVEKQRGLEEIYQALKVGGILSITEVFPDPHYQSRATVRRLAEGAGFRLVEEIGTWLAFTMNFQKPGNP